MNMPIRACQPQLSFCVIATIRSSPLPAPSITTRWASVQVAEIAAAEKINASYLCRVLRLTLLAPEVVEAILDGRQGEEVALPALMEGMVVEWSRQTGLPD